MGARFANIGLYRAGKKNSPTGPQGDTRAILYDGNIEYELRGVLAKIIHIMRSKKKSGCIKVVSWGLGYLFQ